MRKFLYVRIVAIVVLVLVSTGEITILYREIRDWTENNWWLIPSNMVFFALFAINSIAVLYLYARYYPDKEITSASLLFYRISAFCGFICVCWMIFIVSMEAAGLSDDNKQGYLDLVGIALFIILLSIQLLGGNRLLRTIRTAARKQLEDSFA